MSEAPHNLEAEPVRYVKPNSLSSRTAVSLAQTPSLLAGMQVVPIGGGTALHSHPNLDGVWFVLRGRARFFNVDDVAVADLGPDEGVLLTHSYPYRYENVGDEDLEILVFEAFLRRGDPIELLRHDGGTAESWSTPEQEADLPLMSNVDSQAGANFSSPSGLDIYEPDGPLDQEIKVLRYVRPTLTRNRQTVTLARTASLVSLVQVIAKGGGTTLHSHPNLDGFWFVLRGRARFYTTNDVILAELGPEEGILIPASFPYWFEGVSDEDVEIFLVEAFLRRGEPVQRLRLGNESGRVGTQD